MTEGWFHAPTEPTFDDAGNCVSAVDWRGNRFSVGEDVMYCIGAGRGQMMAIGRVLAIKAKDAERVIPREAREDEIAEREWDYKNYDTGEITHHRVVYDRTPYKEVTVQVLTEKTSGAWDNEKRSRPAWPNPMNITSLNVHGGCL